jgi:hypothetical protein
MGDAISKCEGFNAVSRCWDQPGIYPAPSAPTAYVIVYWRERAPGEPASAWNQGPTLAPNASGKFHFNPDTDKNVELAPMPYSASGTPAYASIEEAFAATLLYQRETSAPTIGLNTNVTVDTAQIGIAGFTRFARLRRLRVWADAGMTTKLREYLLDSDSYASHYLPLYFILTREAGALTTESGDALTTEAGSDLGAETEGSSLPDTVYVTVAHSGGNGWTPESNVLQITFAAGDGSTAGSPGSFDPTPRDSQALGVL